MANPEHLEILMQGLDTWNSWRERNAGVIPDLSGAILQDINVHPRRREAANLRGVIFSRALLFNANLVFADLSGANFTQANLNYANLSVANLQGAILREAFLGSTNLCYAKLNNADMTSAVISTTIFGKTDLSDAIGLDTCIHHYPSTIDHRTIAISGQLPLSFLRGCGLPDTLIDYYPALLLTPIQLYACFISYSTRDQRFANRLYDDLQNNGVRCWLATEDLKIGAKTRASIDEAIRMHDKLLLILSKHSVASVWVEQEVETALERERREKRTVLFPIRLDDAVMKVETGWPALVRNTRNIGDFRKWKQHDSYQQAFERLLRDLKAGS